ncbi:MAG: hemerythrin domain-containing protein [Dermatophilaceae bacterium]
MIRTSMNALIHGAFRRDLGRFAAALDEVDDDDQARVAGLKLAWRNFHRQLVEHHEGEHTTAWPALVSLGVDASVLAEMDGEHDVMASRLSVADAAFGALGSPGSAESARSALTGLRGVTEQHFNHEVAVLEPVYLREADSAPIKAMERAFLRHQTPRGAGVFFAWLQDGRSAADRAAIRALVPGPVLTLLPALLGRSYTRRIAPLWR